jgi:predicted AlkP superfamily pyrophosphatase or phosphodiesterase
MIANFAETRRFHWSILILIVALCAQLSAQSPVPVIESNRDPNSPTQQTKPYVVLVSLDGFRYDYAQRYGAKNLMELASQGASAAEGMLPVYPSVTFPNHYSIVTGLYPEHHGIVAMSFYDADRKQRYAFNDPVSDTDGTWYGGVPLWSLAEQQNMKTACFFWPGSEAEIAGKRPSYYLHFDDHFPDEARIDQVIAWLRLAPEKRPHFITLYYSNVDHAGHEFGPDSQQTAEAVRHVDELVGILWKELKTLDLPIDLFVVSDHGMESIQGNWINLDQFADLSGFLTEGMLMYPNSDTTAQKAYEQLKGASDKFAVYRRKDVPKALHYNENVREGDPVVVPKGPYAIRAHAPNPTDTVPKIKGGHGYDPEQMKTMRAIFYAVGPDIRTGVEIAPFENVDIFPVIVRLLGLKDVPNDGDLKVLQGILHPALPSDRQVVKPSPRP